MSDNTDWSQLGLDANPFAVERRIFHIPDSWQRLVSVIRRQAENPGFLLIDAAYGAGKTSFCEILQKKMVLDDYVHTHYIQLHPLATVEQILKGVKLEESVDTIVILDDANEVSNDFINQLLSLPQAIYWVLLADTQFKERLPKLQNRRLALPLFNKEDTHKVIAKQFQGSSRNIEISNLDSEIIYYESNGLPSDILRLAQSMSSKLILSNSSNKSFDSVNKSMLSSLIIGVAILVFVLFIIFNREEPQKEPEQLSGIEKIEQEIRNYKSISGSETLNIEASDIVNKEHGELKLAKDSDTSGKESNNDSESKRRLDSPNQDEGELNIKASSNNRSLDYSFEDWISLQDPSHFSIQLFANQNLEQANMFKQKLGLEDSYIYRVTSGNKTLYRVLWGSYPNRARAQLAIQTLPKEIINQQPWLRSFQSILKDIKK